MNTDAPAQAQAAQPDDTPLPPLSLSLAEIESDLYGRPAIAPEQAPPAAKTPEPQAPEPRTPATPAAETPPEPIAEAQPAETPQTETPAETPDDKPPEPPSAETELPERIRTSQFSDIEQEAIALRHRLKKAGEEVPSLKEAIELVEVLREKTKPAAPEPTPAIEAREALATERSTIETELADVSAKLTELAEAESPFTQELHELQQKHNSLTNRLASVEQREQARVADARRQSRNAAIEVYPTAGDASSALGRQINADIAELTANPSHPDRALLLLENAPEAIAAYSANKLAAQIASKNGISRAAALQSLMAKAPEAKAPTTPPTSQPRKVAPVSGTASTKAEAPKPEPWNPANPQTFQPEAYNDLYAGRKGLIFRL